jgi:thiamine kinase-like enzyme
VTPGEAIDRIRRLVPGVELCRELHAGPVSSSYLVRGGEADLVMRVDSALAVRLQLDRELEVQIMAEAANAGLAPRIVGLDPGPPAILLREFIAGRAWDAHDFGEPARIARLAILLRSVHDLPAQRFQGRAANLADVIRRYLAILGAASRDIGEYGLAMLGMFDSSSPWPVALCHRDPTPGNILEDPAGRLWLNDWEYAGPGDRLFDVAVAASAAENMLDAYVENSAAAGLAARFAEFRRLYALILILWLRVLEREQPLTGDQLQELRESERSLSDRP